MKLNAQGIKEKNAWIEKGYSLPEFDREYVKANTRENPFWIHFGPGNIFRAFQANTVQKLLNNGLLDRGLIVAEGYDYEIVERMNHPHDDYNILVTLKSDGTVEKTVIGSVMESLTVNSENEADWSRLKEIFTKDSLQIVSFTITEKGYCLVNSSGEYFSDVLADFNKAPEKASSYMGKVSALLYERYKSGAKSVAMVSMDNCSHNGDKLYGAVNEFAEEWIKNGVADKGFVDYINDKGKVSFPWTMIDKITPRPDASVELMLNDDNIEDIKPVVTTKNTWIAPFVNAEEAEYLVMEDSFPNGRPEALEEGGFLFTDRETVDKVEKMKVCTCLNPLHTALAIFGCLLGYTKISDEMNNPVLKKMVEIIGYKEGLPVVVNPLIIDPKEFIDTVINIRIPNPFMPDTPQRIATDTSQKLAIRFGETIKAYAESDELDVAELKLIPLVFAGWLRYLMGIDDDGKNFELSPDPLLKTVCPYIADLELGKACNVEEAISPLLKNDKIWGVNLYDVGIAKKVVELLNEMIQGKGAVISTIKKHLVVPELHLEQISSLEKVFINDELKTSDYQHASVLKGEEFAYQIAYCCEGCNNFQIKFHIESPILKHIKLFKVVNVPSETPAYKSSYDENYITTEPGLFPDLLEEITSEDLDVSLKSHAIWIQVNTDKEMASGVYPITITFIEEKYEISESKTFYLEVINAILPKQELIFTQWLHADCIASYYNLEMFSEQHWILLEKFIRTATNNGINMMLTPIFTPPLDTMVNGERPTVQLVDVFKDGEKYTFGFEKLKRWIDLCRECGIQYFEMSHLFTQWGAKFTPKIMAYENGCLNRIFGWDVEATSDKYEKFLKQFLPALITFLKQEGVDKNTYFHVSDEPSKECRESYVAAKNVLANMLNDFTILEALSNYEFYETGAVKNPVPANDHIGPFLDNNVSNLWTYYCCSQNKNVSNRFFAMPSYRNRIMGIQMYKNNIVGFLHWGYNFYYSQFSKQLINPFIITDCYGAFPSGDAFSVYPGINGPLESLRIKVFKYGLQDMQALKYLENLMSKEDIIDIIDSEQEVTFDIYPQSAEYILNLREKINRIIKESVEQ